MEMTTVQRRVLRTSAGQARGLNGNRNTVQAYSSLLNETVLCAVHHTQSSLPNFSYFPLVGTYRAYVSVLMGCR